MMREFGSGKRMKAGVVQSYSQIDSYETSWNDD